MQTRIAINLASEPFRGDRALLFSSIALAIVLTAAWMAQALLVYQETTRAEQARIEVARLDSALSRSAAERVRLEQSLREAQNAEVFDRNVFLNTLIARKAVSWTQLFADLEKVMPGSVRLVSVRPQITTANQVVLDMTVGSLSGEPVVDMLMRLEASPLFGATTITTMLPPSQNETLYRYRLSVNYAQRP